MSFPLIVIILVLIGIIAAFYIRKNSSNNSEKYGYGWPYEFPPLNYFESAETPILSFWYDPVVSADTGSQTTWNANEDRSSSEATNLDDVFGPDSYVRYNIEDIDVSQPE